MSRHCTTSSLQLTESSNPWLYAVPQLAVVENRYKSIYLTLEDIVLTLKSYKSLLVQLDVYVKMTLM